MWLHTRRRTIACAGKCACAALVHHGRRASAIHDCRSKQSRKRDAMNVTLRAGKREDNTARELLQDVLHAEILQVLMRAMALGRSKLFFCASATSMRNHFRSLPSIWRWYGDLRFLLPAAHVSYKRKLTRRRVIGLANRNPRPTMALGFAYEGSQFAKADGEASR